VFKILRLALFLLLSIALCAQTHTFPAMDTNNVFTGTDQFQLGVQVGPKTFATLPAETDGTIIFCSDCKVQTTCAGSGTGAFAEGVGGAWNCNNPGGSGGSGGGNPTLDNCTPDQTGNSFYNVLSLTNYFYGHWEFVTGQSSYIMCTIFLPNGPGTNNHIILDIAANDATAGHTANFQTCDQVINSGTINIGALTCAPNQAFTTTATAYNRVTLTFNVQSTISVNSILVVKIATSTTGTQPANNMLVYPHFVL
jgi:hypothetical protein